MKFIFPCLLFLVYNNLVKAQDYRDAVYLKDESIIRGRITAMDSSRVKIETCCGSILVYDTGDIARIEKEQYSMTRKMIKESGYISQTTMGTLLGPGNNTKAAPFSLLTEHEWRFRKYFLCGLTLGYEVLNEALMPVGLNIRGLLPPHQNLFFLGVTGGYSVSIENPDQNYFTKAEGGFFVNPEAGVFIPVSQNISLVLAAGYRYNELNYQREDWYLGDVKRRIFFNRLSLRLGISLY